MYQLTVEQDFDAAHFLRGYQGKCEALHGHRYRVVARVKASKVNEIGIAYDFTELKEHLADTVKRFDHHCLNDMPPFDRINPSAENIATTVYQELENTLAGAPVSLVSVEVWESPGSGAAYIPD